jgi:hypothetical protein
MRYLVILIFAFLALRPAVAADDLNLSLGDQNVTSGMGQGIICDTREQAVRFVELRNDGVVTTTALDTVNEEAKNPGACGTAVVAFTEGEALAEKTMRGLPVRIVKITIVAANNGIRWAPVRRTVQYTIIAREGLDI